MTTPNSVSSGDWTDLAACRTADPELFFPLGAGKGFEDQILEALEVCFSCEVRRTCLEIALSKPEKFGIWGGMTEDERADERRRRARRRYYKQDAAAS